MPERPPRLIVLPPSHFCERARWGLDHAGTGYTEERWAVGLHLPLARRVAGGSSLPILLAGAETIQGSDRILDWLKLPSPEPALEHRFETQIGPLVRRYLYAAMLGNARSPVREMLFEGVPAWQARMGRLIWPATRKAMIAGMDARAGLVPALERELGAELDWFDDLAGRTRYLGGDRFGRADITAASLLAPIAMPPECPLYRPATLPPAVAIALRRWADRPSLRWVRRTYAEHRR